jgi:hypothetical protein
MTIKGQTAGTRLQRVSLSRLLPGLASTLCSETHDAQDNFCYAFLEPNRRCNCRQFHCHAVAVLVWPDGGSRLYHFPGSELAAPTPHAVASLDPGTPEVRLRPLVQATPAVAGGATLAPPPPASAGHSTPNAGTMLAAGATASPLGARAPKRISEAIRGRKRIGPAGAAASKQLLFATAVDTPPSRVRPPLRTPSLERPEQKPRADAVRVRVRLPSHEDSQPFFSRKSPRLPFPLPRPLMPQPPRMPRMLLS